MPEVSLRIRCVSVVSTHQVDIRHLVASAGPAAALSRLAAGGFASGVLAAATAEERAPPPGAPGARGYLGYERLHIALHQAAPPPAAAVGAEGAAAIPAAAAAAVAAACDGVFGSLSGLASAFVSPATCALDTTSAEAAYTGVLKAALSEVSIAAALRVASEKCAADCFERREMAVRPEHGVALIAGLMNPLLTDSRVVRFCFPHNSLFLPSPGCACPSSCKQLRLLPGFRLATRTQREPGGLCVCFLPPNSQLTPPYPHPRRHPPSTRASAPPSCPPPPAAASAPRRWRSSQPSPPPSSAGGLCALCSSSSALRSPRGTAQPPPAWTRSGCVRHATHPTRATRPRYPSLTY